MLGACCWRRPRSRAEGGDIGELVDRSELRVCADPAVLPFSNEQGEGFENKIAELMAEQLGVPLVYTWYPQTHWASCATRCAPAAAT